MLLRAGRRRNLIPGVVIRRRGSVWACGDNLYGGLGFGDPSTCAARPTVVEPLLLENMKAVAAGWAHSAGVTEAGGVYVWGQAFELRNVLRLHRTAVTSGRTLAQFLTTINQWMTPSHAPGIFNRPTAMVMVDDQPAVDVACGAGITGVLTKDGALYMFGLNGYGQCGAGLETNQIWQPTRTSGVLLDHAVTQVALGFQHGLALTHSRALRR